MATQKILPRVVGLVIMAFALWCCAAIAQSVPPNMLDSAIGVLVVLLCIIGGSGLLLFLRSYRLLAKLWIGVFAVVMLCTLCVLPQRLGINLGIPNGDSAWPLIAWSAIGLSALWVSQRFVIIADEIADRNWAAAGKVEQSDGAESR